MKNDTKSLTVAAETVATEKESTENTLDLKIKRVRVTSKVKAGAATWGGGCSCFSNWNSV